MCLIVLHLDPANAAETTCFSPKGSNETNYTTKLVWNSGSERSLSIYIRKPEGIAYTLTSANSPIKTIDPSNLKIHFDSTSGQWHRRFNRHYLTSGKTKITIASISGGLRSYHVRYQSGVNAGDLFFSKSDCHKSPSWEPETLDGLQMQPLKILSANGRWGSGFTLGKYILTNSHVLKGRADYKIQRLTDGSWIPNVEIVYDNPDWDVVLLKPRDVEFNVHDFDKLINAEVTPTSKCSYVVSGAKGVFKDVLAISQTDQYLTMLSVPGRGASGSLVTCKGKLSGMYKGFEYGSFTSLAVSRKKILELITQQPKPVLAWDLKRSLRYFLSADGKIRIEEMPNEIMGNLGNADEGGVGNGDEGSVGNGDEGSVGNGDEGSVGNGDEGGVGNGDEGSVGNGTQGLRTSQNAIEAPVSGVTYKNKHFDYQKPFNIYLPLGNLRNSISLNGRQIHTPEIPGFNTLQEMADIFKPGSDVPWMDFIPEKTSGGYVSLSNLYDENLTLDGIGTFFLSSAKDLVQIQSTGIGVSEKESTHFSLHLEIRPDQLRIALSIDSTTIEISATGKSGLAQVYFDEKSKKYIMYKIDPWSQKFRFTIYDPQGSCVWFIEN